MAQRRPTPADRSIALALHHYLCSAGWKSWAHAAEAERAWGDLMQAYRAWSAAHAADALEAAA